MITFSREKLINAILYFAKNTNYCGKTKLMKLLYFLDFIHFRQTGKSVTEMDYYAWDFGPVPVKVWGELTSGMQADMNAAISISTKKDFQHILAKQKFSDEFFSPRELRILEQVAFIYCDSPTNEMVELTHLENTPWAKTLAEKGVREKIDYFLAIDSKDGSLSLEEASYRVSEREEMKAIFGTT
ncbi:MAG: SocA family protein [Proteobacteria bacterium]|nr:DUF4065 domain-containing protein [Desulfobulbaceae bacterium]MBU4152800.1 SocA family protein [Pseudomonadota bacterium]